MTNYIIYSDKNEDFECSIQLEGADLNKACARLIIETSNDINLYFNGSINTDGKCTIPLSNVKKYLKEDTTGKLALEVIVEDTYFKPWQSNFIVSRSKKATVIVKEQTTRPTTSCDVTIKEQHVNEKIVNKQKLNNKNKINEQHIEEVKEINDKEMCDLIKRLLKN